jgi:hypothetical protein
MCGFADVLIGRQSAHFLFRELCVFFVFFVVKVFTTKGTKGLHKEHKEKKFVIFLQYGSE